MMGGSLKFASKAQRTVASREGVQEVRTSLNMILNNPVLCKKALWNNETEDDKPAPKIASFNPDDPDLAVAKLTHSIRLGGHSLLGLGQQVDISTTLSALGIVELDKSVRTVANGTTRYLTALQLTFARDEKQAVKAETSLNLPMYVETDATHQIISCGRAAEASGGTSSLSCQTVDSGPVASGSYSASASVSCPEGKTLTGGGCNGVSYNGGNGTGGGAYHKSYPVQNTWRCEHFWSFQNNPVTAYAVCCS